MKLYLGTHEEGWLHRPERPDVPLFVSRRRLARRPSRRLRPAARRWALDSGAFTELAMHGRWTVSPVQYAEEVTLWAETIGQLDWAAPMDWPCEPEMVARTGLTVAEHQARTVENFVELRWRLAPALPVVPVLQGYTLSEYRRCINLYSRAGVDLTTEPLVGLGSVCRRQATTEIDGLVSEMAARRLRMHGFGVKAGALRYGPLLASADSTAWSFTARRIALERGGQPRGGCRHRSCANCWQFAVAWRDGLVRRLQHVFVQPSLFDADAPALEAS